MAAGAGAGVRLQPRTSRVENPASRRCRDGASRCESWLVAASRLPEWLCARQPRHGAEKRDGRQANITVFCVVHLWESRQIGVNRLIRICIPLCLWSFVLHPAGPASACRVIVPSCPRPASQSQSSTSPRA